MKYFNLVLVPLLVGVAGLIALARRRRKTREPYRPLLGATRAGSGQGEGIA